METLEFIVTTVVRLSVVSVFIAVAADFQFYNKNNAVTASKKSVVATGSMTAFFLVYYSVLRWGPGAAWAGNKDLAIAAAIIGALMIAVAAIVNIRGRLDLRHNWANHIKIYTDHQFITTGVYKWVRHPLYASLMLMLFGGGILYRNGAALLLTVAVFIPFMRYRAKQEEELLAQRFEEYAAYKCGTGMFFPRMRVKPPAA